MSSFLYSWYAYRKSKSDEFIWFYVETHAIYDDNENCYIFAINNGDNPWAALSRAKVYLKKHKVI